jgi:GH25 family lysozyme M1 (1,4-beta-N-acetylmuramidase)
VVISFADLSHHQEDVTAATDVDLAAYARAGHDRVAFKATQGRSFLDPYFASWWRSAGALGLARVAYHFAGAEQSGSAEFDFFLTKVLAAGSFGAHDVLCLDIEDVSSAGAQARADQYCREFTTRAVARGCPAGIVYTGRWYAEPNNIRPDDLSPGWRRLWISDYGPAADTAIRLPIGWTRDQIAARQYGSAVHVAGIRTPCDYSRVLTDWLTTTPTPEDDMSPDQDATLKRLDTAVTRISTYLGILTVGDDADDAKDPGTHPYNLQALAERLDDLTAAVGRLGGTINITPGQVAFNASGQVVLTPKES